jgi:hypothetical protein
MTTINSLDVLAGKLTEAQREAILTAPSTPLGNVWLTCSGSTKSALVRKQLANGHGNWCTLNTQGLALRSHLEKQ